MAELQSPLNGIELRHDCRHSAFAGPSVRCVGRQFGGVQYSSIEYHFHDAGIGINGAGRILSQ